MAPRTTSTAVGRRPPRAPCSGRCGSTSPRRAPSRAGSTQALTNKPAAVTSARGGATPSSDDAAPPTSAPASPPKLNPACRPERMGRPTRASTCTPTAFAATFTMPVAAPKKNSATQRARTDDTSPGSTAPAETAIAAAADTGPAPYRADRAPVARIAARAPSDRHSSATPSWLSVAPTWAATSGTREAQLPKTAPSRRKRAVTAARNRATDGVGTRLPAARSSPVTGTRGRDSAEGVDMGTSGKTPATASTGGHKGQGRAHDLG